MHGVSFLETDEVTVTMAAVALLGLLVICEIWVSGCSSMMVDKHARLRLEVLYAEVWSQNVLRELLLQLLLDFLPKSQVNLCIFWV